MRTSFASHFYSFSFCPPYQIHAVSCGNMRDMHCCAKAICKQNFSCNHCLFCHTTDTFNACSCCICALVCVTFRKTFILRMAYCYHTKPISILHSLSHKIAVCNRHSVIAYCNCSCLLHTCHFCKFFAF